MRARRPSAGYRVRDAHAQGRDGQAVGLHAGVAASAADRRRRPTGRTSARRTPAGWRRRASAGVTAVTEALRGVPLEEGDLADEVAATEHGQLLLAGRGVAGHPDLGHRRTIDGSAPSSDPRARRPGRRSRRTAVSDESIPRADSSGVQPSKRGMSWRRSRMGPLEHRCCPFSAEAAGGTGCHVLPFCNPAPGHDPSPCAVIHMLAPGVRPPCGGSPGSARLIGAPPRDQIRSSIGAADGRRRSGNGAWSGRGPGDGAGDAAS